MTLLKSTDAEWRSTHALRVDRILALCEKAHASLAAKLKETDTDSYGDRLDTLNRLSTVGYCAHAAKAGRFNEALVTLQKTGVFRADRDGHDLQIDRNASLYVSPGLPPAAVAEEIDTAFRGRRLELAIKYTHAADQERGLSEAERSDRMTNFAPYEHEEKYPIGRARDGSAEVYASTDPLDPTGRITILEKTRHEVVDYAGGSCNVAWQPSVRPIGSVASAREAVDIGYRHLESLALRNCLSTVLNVGTPKVAV